jgi:dCTP deaminase
VPVRVYPGQRFLHLILVSTDEPVVNPYRGGYQGQRRVRFPRLPVPIDS